MAEDKRKVMFYIAVNNLYHLVIDSNVTSYTGSTGLVFKDSHIVVRRMNIETGNDDEYQKDSLIHNIYL